MKSVTLTPNSITVVVGQQINLTCTTSYCNPPANISWYKSSTDITSQSTSTRDESGGLVRTASSLQTLVFKMDNEKQVYCAVSNIPGRSVISTVLSVAVWCTYTYSNMMYHNLTKRLQKKYFVEISRICHFLSLLNLVKLKRKKQWSLRSKNSECLFFIVGIFIDSRT